MSPMPKRVHCVLLLGSGLISILRSVWSRQTKRRKKVRSMLLRICVNRFRKSLTPSPTKSSVILPSITRPARPSILLSIHRTTATNTVPSSSRLFVIYSAKSSVYTTVSRTTFWLRNKTNCISYVRALITFL